jgi:hypothetical protein
LYYTKVPLLVEEVSWRESTSKKNWTLTGHFEDCPILEVVVFIKIVEISVQNEKKLDTKLDAYLDNVY